LQPAAVARLNDLLLRYPLPARLTQSGKTFALSDAFLPEAPDDLFAPVVRCAAWLLAHTDRSRIRQCDACVLHFLDTSKKGTRRWCSMRLCGNRLKVAAYQARRRGDD
jgi:predicted RNA-binding Zn ribbon-like protein